MDKNSYPYGRQSLRREFLGTTCSAFDGCVLKTSVFVVPLLLTAPPYMPGVARLARIGLAVAIFIPLKQKT